MSHVSKEQLLTLLSKIGEEESFRGQLLDAAEKALQSTDVRVDAAGMTEFKNEVLRRFRRLGDSTFPADTGFVTNVLGLGDVDRLMWFDKTECSSIKAPAPKRRELPGWGQLDEHQALLAENWQIPPEWNLGDGSTPDCAQWRAWLGTVVVNIAGTIWPVYEPSGVTWATDRVHKLLEADFELLSKLHPVLQQPIKGASSTVLHSIFYSEEDHGTLKLGAGYERYDDQVQRDDLERLPHILEDGYVLKVGVLHLQLKQIFQRPRPHQVAWMQGKTTYNYRVATSANSPSLVSGHCLQGCIAGCNAFVKLAAKMHPQSHEKLQQYTVDIGDRRVFAGIHYPSDNLSSWLTALTLVPFVFEADVVSRVKKFLWQAITTKSEVYSAIKDHVGVHADSPYKPAMEALKGVAP